MLKRIKASDSTALLEAKKIILSGGVIVYPTDTLYGFGVDATNSSSVARINKIKQRSGPISVIADSIERIREWTTIADNDMDGILQYIGGTQTVILPVHPHVTVPEIQGPGGSLGIRIPEHSFGPHLVSLIKRPITTTSVNRSGELPLNDPDQISSIFNNEIDLLIDDGIFPATKGSRIYKYLNGNVSILR